MEKTKITIYCNLDNGKNYVPLEDLSSIGIGFATTIEEMFDKEVQEITALGMEYIESLARNNPDNYEIIYKEFSANKEKNPTGARDNSLGSGLFRLTAAILILAIFISMLIKSKNEERTQISKPALSSTYLPDLDEDSSQDIVFPDELKVLSIYNKNGEKHTTIFEKDFEAKEEPYLLNYDEAEKIFGKGLSAYSKDNKVFKVHHDVYKNVIGLDGELHEYICFGEDPTKPSLAYKLVYTDDTKELYSKTRIGMANGIVVTTSRTDDSIREAKVTGGMTAFGENLISGDMLEDFAEENKNRVLEDLYEKWEEYLKSQEKESRRIILPSEKHVYIKK